MSFDVVVVGGGAAGMHVALEVAGLGGKACLVSRKPLTETASFHAQGGLAAALADDDSPARHGTDTLDAGRQASRPSAVDALVEGAPAAVAALEARGVEFDRDAEGRLELGLEGGHSARRVVHAGGAETGRAITGTLAALVANEPGVQALEGASVRAVWADGERCAGVVANGEPIAAKATILTTGGAAALWERTTNPWGAIGAGPVLAHLAGAELADLELCQFHPTALALPGSELDGALITEAIRGEGALLLDSAGRRFTDELAPRDVVSAAIGALMSAEGSDSVGLDLSPVDLGRFPAIARTLDQAGLDPRQPVPVAPAAHYTMGGVATDLDGRSTLAGLYAVGECACNGLHGANRLASNSLSECFVFGTRAARAALDEQAPPDAPPPTPSRAFEPPTTATRAAMWRLAGPLRTAAELQELAGEAYPLAALTARSALARTESRGPHIRADYPERDPAFDGVHVITGPDGGCRLARWT